MKNGEIHLVINTPLGKASYFDEKALGRRRRSGGSADHDDLRWTSDGRRYALRRGALTVKSLQEVYG
jgi:hypothetical protein